jgi:Domain of Unknown Function (DUF928)
MRATIITKIGVGLAFGAGVFSFAAAHGQTNAGSGSGRQTTAPQPQPQPARVRVKLDGFDLAPQASHGGLTPSKHSGVNQIGGASRGIGGVILYAPDKGLAYSLHPTFQWSGSQNAKYKLEITDLAEQTSYEVTVDGASFTYPETAPALKPGSTYSWKVQPEIDMMGGASDTALIVIAGGPERDKIEDALAAVPQTGEAGARARAQVFFDQRIWYDAAHDYSVLIAAHPDDPELHRMRGTLYDQVSATEKLADQDFAMAK